MLSVGDISDVTHPPPPPPPSPHTHLTPPLPLPPPPHTTHFFSLSFYLPHTHTRTHPLPRPLKTCLHVVGLKVGFYRIHMEYIKTYSKCALQCKGTTKTFIRDRKTIHINRIRGLLLHSFITLQGYDDNSTAQ